MRPALTDIFFDLDHTLWDFDRNSALAFDRLFAQHGLSIPLNAFIEVYEPINLRYWKLYREDKISKQELRRSRFSEAFGHFEHSFDTMQLDLMAQTYIAELPKDNHLLEGAIETLEYLASRYRLHIITNGFHDVQHLKLRNSNIERYFRSITSSEEAGYKKPHRQIFHYALSRAGTSPENTVMIGDSFEADIQGAEQAGMETIFFNYRKEQVSGAYRVVHKLAELREHL